MRRYFSCSKFICDLRQRFNIDKPLYAGFDEWDDWNKATKQAHPYGYFLTETLPKWLDDVWDLVTSPYYNTRYYIRNRFIRKTHVMRTDCPVGEYQDTDSRLLSAMANAVIDFVEIELAYKSAWCVTEASKTAVWRDGRCPDLGLDYLRQEQQMVYDDNEGFHEPEIIGQRHAQAITADEILAIYQWAKDRPNRADPYDASGWTEYCEECRVAAEAAGKSYFAYNFGKHRDPVMEAKSAEAMKRMREIEISYDDEDTDMLMRIVKIRKHLWS